MSIELKIKSKHLSEEARIIRFEERKEKRKSRYKIDQFKSTGMEGNDEINIFALEAYKTFRSLRHHRVTDVRNENRATFLARAYIAGVPYKTVEQKRKPEREYDFRYKVLPRVKAMVSKYHRLNVTLEDILIWVDA